jgi:uncharacterized protein YjiS (DUF1127 family)
MRKGSSRRAIHNRRRRRHNKEPALNFEAIRRYFRERRVYWDTMRELSTYTDRELHDIGIDRADIEHIARQAAQG